MAYADNTSAHVDSILARLSNGFFGEAGTARGHLERIQMQRSLLDSRFPEEAASLKNSLSTRDRARVNDYLDNIREIKQRVKQDGNTAAIAAACVVRCSGRAFADFLQRACGPHVRPRRGCVSGGCDACIYIRDIPGNWSQRTYPQIGITEQHHSISHHQNNPEKIAKVA